MSQNHITTESSNEDGVFEKWGCAIFILAAILLGIQRYIAFAFLYQMGMQGNQAAQQLHMFLFGSPPYSIIDILLGFEISDQGLFFLFQPHNWLLGLIQAIHFGLNVGLAYIPFLLLAGIIKLTKKSTRRINFIIILLLISAMIAILLACINLLPGTNVAANIPATLTAQAPTITPTFTPNLTVTTTPTETPNSPTYHLENGRKALVDKNNELAIEELREGIEADPANAEAYYLRGTAYYGRYEAAYNAKDPKADGEDFWRAISDFTKAIELNHNYAEAYHYRGLTYHGIGLNEQALADYDQAIAINPNMEYSYYGRGLIYEEQGQKEDAIANYEKFLDLSNDPYWRSEAQKRLEALKNSTP